MIIKVDNEKVFNIANSHNGNKRDAIYITKAGISGFISVCDDTIQLGYNEEIVCADSTVAFEMFEEIIERLY
ncbi:MAG: hypothetical protein J7L15_02795 [Clostridiales bacterium]|nr:hypothetical protein [Clostridiales bacterium]